MGHISTLLAKDQIFGFKGVSGTADFSTNWIEVKKGSYTLNIPGMDWGVDTDKDTVRTEMNTLGCNYTLGPISIDSPKTGITVSVDTPEYRQFILPKIIETAKAQGR